MNLAVIPARGGSKRIPRKNVKPFAGLPMISYAIRAARQCEIIDRVIVSTDDEEIAEIARQHGAELPFIRPAELADDHTPTAPVIAHAIGQLGEEKPDFVCCIYPAVPFIEEDDIKKALSLLQKHDGRGYSFPVAEFPSPIQRGLKLDQSGKAEPFDRSNSLTRTQDLEAAYYDVGQFYWARRETWLEAGAIHTNAHCLVIPQWRAVDIDTPEDWARAERLFSAYGL